MSNSTTGLTVEVQNAMQRSIGMGEPQPSPNGHGEFWSKPMADFPHLNLIVFRSYLPAGNTKLEQWCENSAGQVVNPPWHLLPMYQ